MKNFLGFALLPAVAACSGASSSKDEAYQETLDCYAVVTWTELMFSGLAEQGFLPQRDTDPQARRILRDELMARGGAAGKTRADISDDVSSAIDSRSKGFEAEATTERETMDGLREASESAANCLADLSSALTETGPSEM